MNKILVIEDEKEILEDLKEILDEYGFDVTAASNGSIGIELALSVIPDMIICDIMMPGINGFEVLEKLRNIEETASIPFIFLTAKSQNEDIRIGMESGADDYLTKPFEIEQLISTIKARLSRFSTINETHKDSIKKMKESILYSLPHELRTPLNTILGFSDIIINNSGDLTHNELSEIGELIYSSGKRLLRIVSNYSIYIDLTNISGSNSTFDNPYIQTNEIIIETAIKVAKNYEREKDLSINIQKCWISIDPHHFSKLIEEVVDNSFKFSKENTAVSIEDQISDDKYIIKISDSSTGLDEVQVKRIDAFVQFDRKSKEQQGLGLGLAIVKKIAELNGIKLNIITDENVTKTDIIFSSFKENI